jgi:hypothetical protein
MVFWLIDVVPARGENAEEARNITLHGKVVWLDKKLSTDIENWSENDSQELVSLLNWRARLFFNGRKRLEDQLSYKGNLKAQGARSRTCVRRKSKRLSVIWTSIGLKPHY